MDTQEAYERIRAWFDRPGVILAKKDPDIDMSGCFYRGPNGSKCAVGALIPDSMYVGGGAEAGGGMECGTIDHLLDEWPVVKGYLYDVDFTFLRNAQRLHDTKASDARTFVVMLDLLAAASGLRVSDALDYTPKRIAA